MTEKVRDFLEPSDFYALLKERGLDFYAGVPDSLLSDFCAYVTDASPAGKHVITANEGAAVGLAAGYYLATRKFPSEQQTRRQRQAHEPRLDSKYDQLLIRC